MSEYVTIKELAKRSSMSEKTVSKLIKRGAFPHYRPDPRGKILIRWSEFEAWMESRRIQMGNDADAIEILETLFAR